MEAFDRRGQLLSGVTKDMLGIEIGPWFAPLVPKREGYRALTLDVFDRQQLLENARRDPSIPPASHELIEEVDLQGSAADLAELVEKKGLTGQIDYIVSSHNFEHLPNPILFLIGCQRTLKPGGLLSMAIPDRRATFDFYRPVSTTGDFLEAFLAGRQQPNLTSHFEQASRGAVSSAGDDVQTSWEHDQGPGTICPDPRIDLESAYAQFVRNSGQARSTYFDAHVSIFTRSSFELIVRDLHFVGIIDLGVDDVSGPSGCEFYARLKKGLPAPSKDAFYEKRAELLNASINEGAGNSDILSKLEKRVQDLETEMQSVLASNSWKFTAPLRRLSRAFGLRH